MTRTLFAFAFTLALASTFQAARPADTNTGPGARTGPVARQARVGQPSPARTGAQHTLDHLAPLPLRFEANEGQTDALVKFVARGQGYTVFLTGSDAVIGAAAGSAVRMRYIGANAWPTVRGSDAWPGRSNYLRGRDQARWHRNIRSYRQIEYQSLYPGVDLVYYGQRQQLEYDFVVAPGADPRVVTIGFEGLNGADRLGPLVVRPGGDVVLPTRSGDLRFARPRIFQERDGRRQEIPGGYELRGANQVGFHVAEFDPTRPLVIDPTLSYSTYLGGSLADEADGIAVDANGNVYVTGSTASLNFPTANALQPTRMGDKDAFVTVLDPTGQTLIYSTYLGGNDDEEGNGIAVDASGNVFVVGATFSSDFPVTPGAIQTTLGGGSCGADPCPDAFVASLDPTGQTLVYGTYLGGNNDDQGFGIAVDASDNAYVTGRTRSANFPTTSGGFQTSLGGGIDAFVAKIDPTGQTLVYSTFLGGAGDDEGMGVAVDAAGDAFVTGGTESANFPTTPGAFQTTPGGGSCGGPCSDAFVTELDPAGATTIYSTYLGGNNDDKGAAIALDASGSAYVTGDTRSANFPTTAGAFQQTFGGGTCAGQVCSDAFVAKVSAGGSSLGYSTFLGGSDDDEGKGIALDGSGNAFVTGGTSSANFPTANPIQPYRGGACDAGPCSEAFVTKLNALGSQLVYSTFVGGTGDDQGNGIAVDATGAYVAGITASANFPVVNARQGTFGGGKSDAFILKVIE